MSFTSIEFLIVLALLAGVYRVWPARWHYVFLFGASYTFYVLAGLQALTLLALVTLLTFAVGKWIGRNRERGRGRAAVAVACVALGGYLIFFKVAAALPKHGAAAWIMPLGLSYYTFKLIGYVLDVYWARIQAENSIIAFAAYVAFFPQIVAGPIQRADFFVQKALPGAIAPAVLRIAWGIAKKLVIADNLAPAVNYVFSHIASPHTALWVGFYSWPLQLYADFSGLTDIAIGAGLLFGIRGPENFNRPFTASSISDFWRRWHMSLTTWLVDYLFTPLRMATRNAGSVGLIFSITVNMLAIGLWHGLTWGYFVFGAVHSLFLSVDALTVRRRKNWFKKRSQFAKIGGWVGGLLTFHLVAFALVFFRAETVADGWSLIVQMWTQLPSGLASLGPQVTRLLMIGLAGYLVLEICERFRADQWAFRILDTGPQFARWSLVASMLLILTLGFLMLVESGGGSKNPFVYAIY